MKILALIERPGNACYRYRIAAFEPALRAAGHSLGVISVDQAGPGRIGLLRAAAAADLVLLQRKLLPAWQLNLLRMVARKLVYDIDDAVFQRDSFHPKGPRSMQRERRFVATVRSADAVIVGNNYLRRCVAQVVPPEKIQVVPTTIQPGRYQIAGHHRSAAGTRLVWIGSSSTLQGLELARRHLRAAAAKTGGFELHLICDREVDFPGVKVIFRPWSAETEAADLARCDIGITWLPNDTWSQGKCGLKVLQYMAAGLPVVANGVGTNRRMVVGGTTGLVADSPTEWAEAIARLASDPSLRTRMGGAGRRLVERRYATDLWTPRLVQTVEAVVRYGKILSEAACRTASRSSEVLFPRHVAR